MRFTHRSTFVAPLALAAFGLVPAAVSACSSCGCTLSNDMFAQGGDQSVFHEPDRGGQRPPGGGGAAQLPVGG